MKYHDALRLAEQVQAALAPHCLPGRCVIAGSIRRKKAECGDIEIVAIPKPYSVGVFKNGIAAVADQWRFIRGNFPCKYAARELMPSGMQVDMFFAQPDNWGLILAIRTGSAAFSRDYLAAGWVAAGYHSEEGFLRRPDHSRVPVREEKELFELIKKPYIEPEKRSY